MRTLAPGEARRIALAAQGFGRPRPGRVTSRHVQAVIDRVALLQIDTVNVLVRAHYMPLFSRLGPYEPALLDAAFSRPPRRLFEFWGHVASFVDVELQPALRFRMAEHEASRASVWGRVVADAPELTARIRAYLRDRGPLTARDIDHVEERRRDSWGWNWSSVKEILEWLFYIGELSSAGRNSAFERRFAPMAAVIPARIMAAPTPTAQEAHEELVRRAARALGVADLAALADYFRTAKAPTLAAVRSLAEAGEIEEVRINGLKQPHWRWREATAPRRVRGQALISPFDSLVFHRGRLQDLFGVDYRIEIYTPEAKRRHGYYVYLFLMDEGFAARVDLKADRKASALLVQATWREPVSADDEIAARLAAELRLLASWQGLAEVEVRPRGDFHAQLNRALAGGSSAD